MQVIPHSDHTELCQNSLLCPEVSHFESNDEDFESQWQPLSDGCSGASRLDDYTIISVSIYIYLFKFLSS